MASSGSLSQESLDHDDHELTSRRSRAVRVARGRMVPPVYTRMESLETTDDNGPATAGSTRRVTGGGCVFTSGALAASSASYDHDSPTRIKVR